MAMVSVKKEDLERAAEMLRIAAEYINENWPEGIIFYDEAECDGGCVANDCESAADMISVLREGEE